MYEDGGSVAPLAPPREATAWQTMIWSVYNMCLIRLYSRLIRLYSRLIRLYIRLIRLFIRLIRCTFCKGLL